MSDAVTVVKQTNQFDLILELWQANALSLNELRNMVGVKPIVHGDVSRNVWFDQLRSAEHKLAIELQAEN